MSQRIFAGIWLVFSVLMAWMARRFEVQFAYEPVGPKAWPLALAAMMAAAALYLLLRPGDEPHWPARPVQLRVVALATALLMYAYVFQWLGFPLATALMTIVVGRLFGGRWLPSGHWSADRRSSTPANVRSPS